MCGIVGYVGNKEVAPILINGLKKLEYRGYDSVGMAVLDDSNLTVLKCKGKLAILEEKMSQNYPKGFIGLGHTRWATHGKPSDINSHPHVSKSGKIAVVHNGIIENYLELKEFLETKGYEFVSETDTEVVGNLVEYNYKGDLVKAVIETLNEIEGSYALGIMCTDCPEMFVAVKKDSALVVGLGKDGNYVASDIPAILDYTRDVYILDDKEVVVLTADNVKVYNNLGVEVKKEVFKVTWDVAAAEKAGYEHFMMKEICEEPKAIKDTIGPRIKNGRVVLDDIELTEEYVKNIGKIHIVACGTAYHAGVIAKYIIEKTARIPVEVDVASEFRYRDPIVTDKDMAIIISQSGETLDTLFALREAKKKGARVLSIVNVVESTIARESDDVLYTWAGPEIAIASTKAYNAQLCALYLLTLELAYKRGCMSEEQYKNIIEGLQTIPDAIEDILGNKGAIQRFASSHCNVKNIFFIGRGLDYALSMEASLKLKEVSYIHSEAYAGGELKHGTIALIEDGTLVVCPVTQDDLMDKMISNIKEVKARGATVLAIARESNEQVHKVADEVFTIPDVDPFIAPVAAVTPLQLFAYYMAVVKGCDVDKPRNLTKSVTVE
ncbi:glutamine--fructose-6-phosphate transaminase (isomerizing) [Acetivibrio saccincola]|uniref:Glutamine--fructose-6-phosphate aminotransferase [isomerizing] n=1 Tax=Acetivibrio saccincola TaxID=1677857 RepID=A0A2S8REZ6_9FIRM|nr:glutamine--fructose-6-phosphate transaminase (isomerizing) [Acetivibrio saccincola]PQQ68328.1 glutamine--fructose-6-phosphate transaminase (isomerizing) [Acetivibrio saccincola]